MNKQPWKRLVTVTFASALALAGASVSHAQTNAARPAGAATQAASPDMRASNVMGKQVRNPQGENLGKIDDLAIDQNGERVYYALVSSGGIAGIGDKTLVFPAESFRISGSDLVLNVDKDALKKAPGFDSRRRPTTSVNHFFRDVDRFYKIEDDRRLPENAQIVSAKDLIGSEVNDHAQHKAGKIEDLVVNFGSGRVYAVLGVDQSLIARSKLVALPLSAFYVPSTPGAPIMFNVDRALLEKANGFDSNNWPDLNSAEYQRTLSNQLLAFQTQAKSNPAATQSGR